MTRGQRREIPAFAGMTRVLGKRETEKTESDYGLIEGPQANNTPSFRRMPESRECGAGAAAGAGAEPPPGPRPAPG